MTFKLWISWLLTPYMTRLTISESSFSACSVPGQLPADFPQSNAGDILWPLEQQLTNTTSWLSTNGYNHSIWSTHNCQINPPTGIMHAEHSSVKAKLSWNLQTHSTTTTTIISHGTCLYSRAFQSCWAGIYRNISIKFMTFIITWNSKILHIYFKHHKRIW